MSELDYMAAARKSFERRGLRDRVYDLVLDMLLTAQVEPGTRLSLEGMARELGVSPTPVREALVQLEWTGLVTREAHKGYRVAPPLADDQLEALFDARLVLEVGTTELAAKRAEAVVPELEAVFEQHVAITERISDIQSGGRIPVEIIRDYFEIDWQFHHVIFEGARNQFLLDMSEAISTRVHRMRQTLASGISDAAQAVEEHGAILDRFRTDPPSAPEAMRQHIEKVRVRARADAQRRLDGES